MWGGPTLSFTFLYVNLNLCCAEKAPPPPPPRCRVLLKNKALVIIGKYFYPSPYNTDFHDYDVFFRRLRTTNETSWNVRHCTFRCISSRGS